MAKQYELYQVIVQDEKGKLYDFNSNYMNENFEVTEYDTLTPIKEEERQQTHCSSCNKITNSSRADYQDEFTCNNCGAEVQEEE